MKYIGVLPYLYLDNPLKIGAIRFIPLIANEKKQDVLLRIIVIYKT